MHVLTVSKHLSSWRAHVPTVNSGALDGSLFGSLVLTKLPQYLEAVLASAFSSCV